MHDYDTFIGAELGEDEEVMPGDEDTEEDEAGGDYEEENP